MGTVEAESAGFELWDGYLWVVNTSIHKRIVVFVLCVGIGDQEASVGNIKSLLNTLRQSPLTTGIIDYSVDNNLYLVLLIFVELWPLVESIDNTIDSSPCESLALILLWDMLEQTFFCR